MNLQPPLDRRQFLATAAVTATFGALLWSAGPKLRAAPPNTTGETDHFWYHFAPEGPYVDSQRDLKAFGFGEEKVFLSEDNCRTPQERRRLVLRRSEKRLDRPRRSLVHQTETVMGRGCTTCKTAWMS
jgi:hypothetical protein